MITEVLRGILLMDCTGATTLRAGIKSVANGLSDRFSYIKHSFPRSSLAALSPCPQKLVAAFLMTDLEVLRVITR